MTLRRYERYKDSGVEWLGVVPAHWEIAPLKRSWTVTDCKHITAEFIPDGIPLVSIREVQHRFVQLDNAKRTTDWFYEQLIEGGRRPQAHDLIFSRNATVGEVAQVAAWHPPFALGQDVCLLRRISPASSSDYMQYVLKSRIVIDQLELTMIGSTFKRINVEEIRGLVVTAPPPAEQEGIAAFLDRETAKIDTLIAEQQRLIELLTEKRQAVIAHAVTKGLNPLLPTKDSGVAWLGEVPAHWSVQPLKHIADFRSGGTPDKGNLDYWDGAVPWASAKDLKVDDLFDTADHITDEALAAGAALLVPVNSILVVVRGMILARIFPVVTARVPMAINQDLKAVTPRAAIDGDYLAWLLRASATESLSRLDEAGHGTKALRMDAWGAMRVPVPPLAEQQQIATHLRHACSMADAGLSDVQRGIALLRERRTALISAAVTGQIDVRDSASAKSALAETRADIAAGHYVVESAAEHVARVQAMAGADE